MRYRHLHPWHVTPAEAAEIQRQLRARVTPTPDRAPRFSTVAGMDVSYDRRSPVLFAGIVVLRLPDLACVDSVHLETEAAFPYLPGLLSFRECPAGLRAWARLRTRPDCVICDGHGYAHPRRFGFASHFGLLADVPTIGVAKSVLVGEYQPPGSKRGSRTDLVDTGEVIGAALRTRTGAAPVFVSIGHRVDLALVVETVLACSPRYRIPEPIRQAHALVNTLRQARRAIQ